MVQVAGFVATERASRYLVQLCSHVQQMSRMRHHIPLRHAGARVPDVLAVEYSADRAVVRVRGGTVRLEATAEALQLVVDAADEKTLRDLQNGFTHRIQTIGRRDQLAVTWSIQPETPAAGLTPTPSGGAASRMAPARFMAVVFAVAAVAIAAHVGLFAVSLAAAGSVWAGAGVFVFVLVVAGVVGVHVILGGVGARMLQHTRHRSDRQNR